MARYKKKLEDDIRCPLEYGLTIFGGKWKSRIICVLAVNEKLRYSELRREMCNDTIDFYFTTFYARFSNGGISG